MGLFTPFFEKLINAIDEVKDLDEDEMDDVGGDPKPVDISDNVDIRAEALRNIERQREERDPFDVLIRRLERSRNLPPSESRAESNTEQQNRIPFQPPPSWDMASTSSPSANTLFADPTAPASATSWFENATPPGILGQSVDRIFVDDTDANASSLAMARIMDQHLLSKLDKMSEPDSDQVVVQPIPTTGNQDYLQLESQFQDFASLVKELLDASTPDDYRIQSERVRESADLILSTRQTKEEPSPIAKKSSSLEIELN